MLQAKCVRHIQLGKTNQIDGPCDELKSVMVRQQYEHFLPIDPVQWYH
jgi:hypothetical protein